jgi:hypothetical protein
MPRKPTLFFARVRRNSYHNIDLHYGCKQLSSCTAQVCSSSRTACLHFRALRYTRSTKHSKTCHYLLGISVSCITKRLFNTLQIPQMYNTMDLSSHNADDTEELGAAALVKREHTSPDYHAFEKQRFFIRTIQERPALGKHVRLLHWLVLDTSSRCWRKRLEDEPTWEN